MHYGQSRLDIYHFEMLSSMHRASPYSTFVNVIVVFKAQATAEVFDMFRIDNIDMSLVAEAFYNLLQAAIIVITLVWFECAVCT